MGSNRNTVLLIRCGVVILLIVASIATATTFCGITPAYAETLEDTACYVFGGHEKCRTVKVFDAEECIIKVHPQPLPSSYHPVRAFLRDGTAVGQQRPV